MNGLEKLPKLTRPRIYEATRRERLFRAMDALWHYRCSWIHGPPGAGKTTLVASYLEDRGHRGPWIQLDKSDADPATFFSFLRAAVHKVTPRTSANRHPLSLLTPEHNEDLMAFSRNFFRAFTLRVSRDIVCVLDNFHEIESSPDLVQTLVAGFEELATNIRILVISRNEPPPQFARLRANGQLAALDWDQLKFTTEECADLLSAQRIARRDLADAVLARTDGWAAGVRLLSEHLTREATPADLRDQAPRETLFSYFAQEILDGMPVAHQTLLMQVAHLPNFTAQYATSLSGNPLAGRIMEGLYRRRLFIDRRSMAQATYQFHPLFRGFLLDQAASRFSADQRRALVDTAAATLVEAGSIDDAIQLLIDCGHADEAARHIPVVAARLFQQGSWRTLIEWLDRLPLSVVERDPWLLYWQGAAMCAFDPVSARAPLIRAFALAEAGGIAACRIRAAAAMVDTYFLEYVAFRDLAIWIPALNEVLDGTYRPETREEEATLLLALSSATLLTYGMTPVVWQCVERMMSLMAAGVSPGLQGRLCFYLLSCANNSSTSLGDRVLPFVTSTINDASVPSLNRTMCSFILAWYQCCAGAAEAARIARTPLERIAERDGLQQAVRFLGISGFFIHATQGRLDKARECLADFEMVVRPGQPYDMGTLSGMRGWLAFLHDDLSAAITHGREAVRVFDGMGHNWHPIMYRVPLSAALADAGHFQEALQVVGEADHISSSTGIHAWRCALAGIRAWVAYKSGDAHALREALWETFGQARATAYGSMLRFLGGRAATLCALALSHDVEVAYTVDLTRRSRYRCPDHDQDSWPWPVRIYTLGTFRIEKDGVELAFGRKAPRRLLQVLKMIVALGGQGVSVARVCDELWPDFEGPAAQAALSAALSRIRDLLGVGDALRSQEGFLSLDDGVFWVDALRLEKELATHQRTQTIVRLVRGNFLAEEEGAPWAAPMRERLRSRYQKHILQAASRLENSGKMQEAAELYNAAANADACSESFYQGEMRCLITLGRNAEALNVFRRAKAMIAAEHGVAPAPETMRLFNVASIPSGRASAGPVDARDRP